MTPREGALRTKLPEIKEGLKPLWESGRYDGALSGFVEYQGKKCYFNIKWQYSSKEYERKVYRSYWIYELTEAQWKEALFWHEEFRLHVGKHCDYVSDTNGYNTEGFTIVDGYDTDSNYSKEMYYDRYELWKQELACRNKHPEMDKITDSQRIGWCIAGVLFEGKWKEWRRVRKPSNGKRKAKNKRKV